jgi:arylsulfatase A-like enzyme
MNGTYVTKNGYETTVQTRLATRFIRESADEPFFLLLNYLAPHGNVDKRTPVGPIPHEDHADDFNGYQLPRTAAFDEANVNDKPTFMQWPRMRPGQLATVDRQAEARLETLQSVDDGMRAIRATLQRHGIEGETNVMFVSDNGFMLGEHRIPIGKVLAYEPSARVPLLMAGPDVPRRGNPSRPVGLQDIASTVTSWFGLGPMPGADGQPLFGPGRSRHDILLQGSIDDVLARSYTGLRTPDGYKYIEYLEGGAELYDLNADPMELRNRADDPAYAALRDDLAERLASLRDCARETCR